MNHNSSEGGEIQNYNGENGSNNQEWSRYENKLFETTLAGLDLNSRSLYENIMAVMPWKTLEQIKIHYEKLIADVAMIERGEISPPNYANNGGGRVDNPIDNNRRKGAPWTVEEHRSFLIGLHKLGKGEWSNISKYYVPSKTGSQVASHGQKYYRRLKCLTPLYKRRYSIHDIRIVNSDVVETSARNPSRHSFITHIPEFDHKPNNNYLTPKQQDKKTIMPQQHFYPSYEEPNVTTSTFNNNNFGPIAREIVRNDYLAGNHEETSENTRPMHDNLFMFN